MVQIKSLKTYKQFQEVFGDQKKYVTEYAVFLYKPNGLSSSRVGWVIRKKYFTKAVTRNRLRRLFKESLRETQFSTGWDVVVVVRSQCQLLPRKICYTTLYNQWTQFNNYLLESY